MARLDAEVRIGQLMREVPKASGGQPYHQKSTLPSGGSSTKRQVIEEAGFSKTQVQRFEELALHPEIVEQAKAEAGMLNFFLGVSSLHSEHGRSSLHKGYETDSDP